MSVDSSPSDMSISDVLNVVSTDVTSSHFFEGAEKLLEIWFDKEQEGATSLRAIPYEELVRMLDIAQCHILHRKSNECMDSYVLSESSMFISDARIILKTCGRTRLLHAMDMLLSLAHRYSHMDSVINVFYSRKNFMRPEIQPHPHNSFEGEIDFLDNYFQDGAAYCMGSLKQDRWFLYTISAPQAPLPYADHTLEIMMSEMPHDVMSVFTRAVCKDAEECTKKSGIDRVVPFGTVIHEELFDPCGYSMNGLLPQTDQYVTIHVTPEPDFSYASFETNQNSVCLYKQTLRVIDIFKPSKFLLTVFANERSIKGKEAQQNLWERDIAGYKRSDLQYLRLQHETLVYAQYVKRKGTGTKNVPLKRAITDDDGHSD
uniref:S-adenosylmethionine decarboxylase proenzyme n=2 Tax=Ascaris TaxID=6251 RepID=F1L3Z4_ASCSU